MFLETKQRTRCKRCGGQVIRSYGDNSCLQCGALHTEEGELVPTYSAQDFEAMTALKEMKLKANTTQKFSKS